MSLCDLTAPGTPHLISPFLTTLLTWDYKSPSLACFLRNFLNPRTWISKKECVHVILLHSSASTVQQYSQVSLHGAGFLVCLSPRRSHSLPVDLRLSANTRAFHPVFPGLTFFPCLPPSSHILHLGWDFTSTSRAPPDNTPPGPCGVRKAMRS